MIGLVVFGALATESCKKGEEDPGLSLRSREGRLAGTWKMMTYKSTNEYTDEREDPDPSNDGNTVMWTGTETEEWDGTNYTFMDEYESTRDDGDKSNNMETWTGGTYTSENSFTSGGTTTSSESEGTYTADMMVEYTFEKDGSFTMTLSKTRSLTEEETNTDFNYEKEEVSEESESYTVSGTWSFLGPNDVDEIANEERVAIWWNDETRTSSSKTEVTYTDTDTDDFFDYTDSDYSYEYDETTTYAGSSHEPDEIWTLIQLSNSEMKAVMEGNSTYTREEVEKDTDSDGSVTTRTNSNGTSSYMMEMTFEAQ